MCCKSGPLLWPRLNDSGNQAHMLRVDTGVPWAMPYSTNFIRSGSRAKMVKSGPGLDFLDRWRRRLRRHWFRRHHGQHSPSPRTARRAAARAGCRLQLKINLPYDVHAGELALSANEKSRWPGRPVGLMVGRVRGSTPRGGTAGGALGSSVVGRSSSSCRGLRGCVNEQPTARRAPRIAPACSPRVTPAPPSSPPASPPLPLTLPSFLADLLPSGR